MLTNPQQECLWLNTLRAVGFWSTHLHSSPYLCRAIKFGVYEKPIVTTPARTRFCLSQIPVAPEDQPWLESELAEALNRRIYEEVPAEQAKLLHQRHNYPISNAFIVHTDKRRLLVNLSQPSKLFRDEPVTMETLESFALELEQNDEMFSFDVAKGYHHFRLHQSIRNWFLFKLQGKFYRCIALPFGWKLSPAYFVQPMRPLVRYIRQQLHLKVHPYIDDFLLATSSKEQMRKGRCLLERTLKRMGLQRKIGKG